MSPLSSILHIDTDTISISLPSPGVVAAVLVLAGAGGAAGVAGPADTLSHPLLPRARTSHTDLPPHRCSSVVALLSNTPLSRFPNSLTVRWEAPGCQATSSSHKYRLTIESAAGAVLLTPDCALSNTCVQVTGPSTPYPGTRPPSCSLSCRTGRHSP